MHGVGEHVDRLDSRDGVVPAKDCQIPRLGCRITTHIDNALRCSFKDDLSHIRMDAGTRGIEDDDIRSPMFFDKGVVQNIFHVSGKEFTIADPVCGSIGPRILNSFWNIFNTNDFLGF